MSLRLKSLDDLPPAMRARVKDHPWKHTPAVASEKTVPRRNKYGAKPAHADGHRFASTLERDRYLQLKSWRETGNYVVGHGKLVSFSLWPVFLLPGGVKAIMDSTQVWRDGERMNVVIEDCKGRDVPLSRAKRKQVEALYGVKVQLWPAGDAHG